MQKSFRKYILPGIIAFSLAALTLLTVFWIIPVVRYSNAEKLLRESIRFSAEQPQIQPLIYERVEFE